MTKPLKKFVIADLNRFGQNKHGYYTGVEGIFSEHDENAVLYPIAGAAESVVDPLKEKYSSFRHPHIISLIIDWRG